MRVRSALKLSAKLAARDIACWAAVCASSHPCHNTLPQHGLPCLLTLRSCVTHNATPPKGARSSNLLMWHGVILCEQGCMHDSTVRRQETIRHEQGHTVMLYENEISAVDTHKFSEAVAELCKFQGWGCCIVHALAIGSKWIKNPEVGRLSRHATY